MWIEFLKDHDEYWTQRSCTAYKAGHVANVPHKVAAKLIDLGVAETSTNPRHASEADSVADVSEDADHEEDAP